MKNYVSSGDAMQFTVPAGGVVAGTAYLIGALLVVADTTDPTAGDTFVGKSEGIFSLPKAPGAWTEGQLLYWDSAAAAGSNIVTAPNATARRIGCAAAAAAATDTIGLVRLGGDPAPVNVA